MRIGMFIVEASHERTDVERLLTNARRAEGLGLATAWVPHMPWTLDGLTALTLAGRVTGRIELGTAVMPTYPRHPLAMAQQALSVQAASAGRLALGIGPSHPRVIEQMHGLTYERPAAHVRSYVEVLRAAFAAATGGGRVDHDDAFHRVHAPLEVPGATGPPGLLVAALAPRMLRVAGELTDGTITYWADERAVGEYVVPGITAAAEGAGRPAPRVVVGVPVSVVADADAAREEAARLFSMYEGIPAYRRILRRGASASPVDAAVIGHERTVAARLRSYADAGATDLCAAVFPFGPDPDGSRRRTEELLASL